MAGLRGWRSTGRASRTGAAGAAAGFFSPAGWAAWGAAGRFLGAMWNSCTGMTSGGRGTLGAGVSPVTGAAPAGVVPEAWASSSMPSRMCSTRLAWAAISGSWVIITMVTPSSLSFWKISIICSPDFVSKAPVGSSASSTLGLFTMARAMATRWHWPPESWVGLKFTRSPRPTRSRALRAISRRSLRRTPA